MAKSIELEQYELTPEGKQLWENIMNYEVATEGRHTRKSRVNLKLPTLEINPYKNELDHIHLELERMITNSQKVIRDCELIISKFTDAKQYLTSDAKVAKELHIRLIKRLQNILDGKSAFS